MATQKLEWLPENPKLIGVAVNSSSGALSNDQSVFDNWDDALLFVAEGYGQDVETFLADLVAEISESTGMSQKRIWSQWFKRESRKVLSWMSHNNLIRVLWLI
jgi:hypothetical protein